MGNKEYDVIVVGAGHAGNEAAAAAAQMGCKTLLVTMNMQTIGQMSCNPAMGGVAKGQILREVDAMGGLSGIVSDKTMIQFRMLNRSKGPAMWSPRTQNDRWRFAEEWRLALEGIQHLHFLQETAESLLVRSKRVEGVRLSSGNKVFAKTVVLTSGTFLNGVMHIGEKQFGGGRAGERAATGITECLNELGFESGRMKTGTPPRLDGRSLDYEQFEVQQGDEQPAGFSFMRQPLPKKQMCCWIAHTSEEVHDVLRSGFDRSPMFNGAIKSSGPRYCPSIEDKIDRFADKNSHQLFVEPEGWNTVEVYLNGFSTSLPQEVQEEALRKIKGFENARFFRPGYAIEYDYFPPTQLTHSLETKIVEGLFFAGQINGTTGYEEAAGQGLMAGLNAARKVQGQDSVVLRRDEAYIGVLIDDLITKGTEEPYRMFTSRAEFRILLRQDNADQRLTPLAHELGLAKPERWQRLQEKMEQLGSVKNEWERLSVVPNEVNKVLEKAGSKKIDQKVKAISLLSRPQLGIHSLLANNDIRNRTESITRDQEVLQQLEIETKYSGYIQRERENAEKLKRLEYVQIPTDFEYQKLGSMSMEARQKLAERRPENIGQASRISGVSPSDIQVLLVYLGR
jgi:tRNA uridine 5-carboxymethylaminomethyl modification enzyme